VIQKREEKEKQEREKKLHHWRLIKFAVAWKHLRNYSEAII
jgi:hypothetical protein